MIHDLISTSYSHTNKTVFIKQTASGQKVKNCKTWLEMKTSITHSFEHSNCNRGMDDEYDEAEIIKKGKTSLLLKKQIK